ncbi:hypothetical protein KAR48_19200 [bacterium]|nr:hypothetical protein [bacterium]
MNIEFLIRTPSWNWPDTTGAFLLNLLKDYNAKESDRLSATHLAGDCIVINDEIALTLLEIIQNDTEIEQIRCSAAISLGPVLEHAFTMEFDDPDDIIISEETYHKIQQMLHRLFQNKDLSEDIRRNILEGSVRAPQEWHKDAIRYAYTGANEKWQLTAVFCMCYIDGFKTEILESLTSSIPNIQFHAIVAAGNWGIAKAWPHIQRILTEIDVDKDLLLVAINASITINPHKAIQVLGELMNSDDEDIVDAADESLTMARHMAAL